MYFNELYTGINERCGEKISKSVLSESLKGLVDELVITRNEDLFYSPLRVQYQLTDKRKELRIIYALIKKWGMKWAKNEKKSNEQCCVVHYLPEIEIKTDFILNLDIT